MSTIYERPAMVERGSFADLTQGWDGRHGGWGGHHGWRRRFWRRRRHHHYSSYRCGGWDWWDPCGGGW